MAKLEFDSSPFGPRASYDNLPDIPATRELIAKRKWVCWKYEERKNADGRKHWTKPPVCARHSFAASVNKPETWSSYADAVQNAQRRGLAGVGWVLTEDDDISGGDLDYIRDPETGRLEDWVQEIVDLAETYTEISPSGCGLRFIWRGSNLEDAIVSKLANVEVYSTGRYLTITGEQLPGTPDEIRPIPKTLELLRARVASVTAPVIVLPGVVEVESGDGPSRPGNEFFRAVNTAALENLSSWVPALFPGARFQNGTGAFRVSSRMLGRNYQEDLSISPKGIKDWGVHDMGDGRQGRRSPTFLVLDHGGAPDIRTAAFWLCERMGRTPESFGWEEDNSALGAELAGQLLASVPPLLDASIEVVPIHGVPALPPPPPGLVGDITAFITATAIYPQPELSLGAALVLVGTAAGRHLAGPTKSGTHLYIIALGPSGSGKDHPLSAIPKIMAAAGMSQHVRSEPVHFDASGDQFHQTNAVVMLRDG